MPYIPPPYPLTDDHRIAAILREAGLDAPGLIPSLGVLTVGTFENEASIPYNIQEAQLLLVQEGASDLDRRKRHIFWSKSKEAKRKSANWVFTKNEVARAFNFILSRKPLPAPGIAQALLYHASVASLEELWRHFCDPNLEKEEERAQVTISANSRKMTWLDQIYAQENLEYILLVCQVGLDQDALNRAFEIALSKHSMDAMKTLLALGAVVSPACQNTLHERVKQHDLALVRLLLSAPNAISAETWRGCLEPEVHSLATEWIQILLLCIAHRPEIISMDMLQKALKVENLRATAIMLAYEFASQAGFSKHPHGSWVGYFNDVRQLACELVSRIPDNKHRHKFFSVLVEAGLVADSLVLRQELVNDVKNRQLSLIKLLVDAGVMVDVEPHNAFHWAVTHLELDTLKLFKSCKFTSPVSLAMNLVPSSTSDSDLLRLVEILGPLGLTGQPLDPYLIRAVRSQHIQLVDTLILYGASVEFGHAAAIRAALEHLGNANFDILNILLRIKCSPKLLSTTIPTAMALRPRHIRLQAMKALLEKGVLRQALGHPLDTLVSEEGVLDSELIQLLLQHKAPVDGVGNNTNNAVLVAARRGNFPILRMLFDASPGEETISKAVAVAFGAIDTCGYDMALSMIKLLLPKAAVDLPIHQTLQNAASQDRLEIARLLLQHGADANHARGAALGAAIARSNLALLRILCTSRQFSQASIASAFLVAVDPRIYTSEAVELLLSCAQNSGGVLNTLWSSDILRGNPNATAIVSSLIRYGLDVNIENGEILSFAIQERNDRLLTRALSANPSITSLTAAFRTATYARPRRFQLDTMRAILEKGDSNEIGQSESILQEVHYTLSGDQAGLRLFLRHQAVATLHTFTKACLAVVSSPISANEKDAIFLSLIALSDIPDKSKLLAHCVTNLPKCTQLPQLLLSYGAEVSFEILTLALETASFNLLDMLLRTVKGTENVVRIFNHAPKIEMTSGRRYWIYQLLLSKGISSENVSRALVDSLESDVGGDLSFTKLFLNNGASSCFQEGKAFSLALRANSPNSLLAVKLLAQNISDDSMATVAFDVICKTVCETPLLKRHVPVETFRILFVWHIDKLSVSQALVDSFKAGLPDISTLQFLLEKGGDPNKDNGHCLALAATAGALAEFQALSKYASCWVLLEALLENMQEESEIIKWFEVFIGGRSRLSWNPHFIFHEKDKLVYKCMRKFPTGTKLLRFLLDVAGLSASTKEDYSLCTDWKTEPCTALIWALFSQPRIANDTILVLLSRTDAALPAYSTPLTKVSAAFGCLLDTSRTPILKALLDWDRGLILDYAIPGSSFGPLSSQPGAFEKDSDILDSTGELPLREASLYLGNCKAFRLIAPEVTRNDGTLHLAALLALPKFVKWLLKTHDPNHKAEEFDNMVPLALVCKAKYLPWCKIANNKSHWRKRQQRTMDLLAGVTQPEWGHRNMTILHWAMENGVETTRAMVKALDFCHDSEKDTKYLYTDRDGVEYSPKQYVRKILCAEDAEKIELISCLEHEYVIPRPRSKHRMKWYSSKIAKRATSIK
ncbi:uncharacterized protein LY89DRAFT_596816 [Mollisia scopiformis]|uniref:Ankyrin n=1 Tax=Mollisia scopiformis TaxID=149040 RepID=A0A132BER9_MOLSC|nr:uncharacterized protein LY89DRAFT_596816 [Mollisia scopiformis]KUJ10177.1 hypothetical protein LY89DRAFT_596816 [Mollisia scopiformis]